MDENKRFAKRLVHDVFKVKENEVVTITLDKGSNRPVITAVLEEVKEVGGMAMAIEIPQPEAPCSGVDAYVPDIVGHVLKKSDCWLDAASKVWLYSSVFDNALKDNDALRYMIIENLDTKGLLSLFDLDYITIGKLTKDFKNMLENAKTIRLTSESGSDITFNTNHNNKVLIDDGDASTPGLHTPPANITIYPEFNSVNGKVVGDALMINNVWNVLDEPFEIVIENGGITKLNGNTNNVSDMEKWIKASGKNSDRVAHFTIGLGPNIHELKEHIINDERLFGSMDCGFGHVSPLYVPPNGQKCKIHFDTVALKVSIWIDDIKIMDKGEFVYPKFVEYSNILLGK